MDGVMDQSLVPRKGLRLALGLTDGLGRGGGTLATGLLATGFLLIGCSLTVAEEAMASAVPESGHLPAAPVLAQAAELPFTPEPPPAEPSPDPAANLDPDVNASIPEAEIGPLDLDPQIIEDGPVLQQWLEEVPDIAEEIRHSPSFRTRLRVGYANFPSNGEISGFQVGVEDVFVWPGTGLTASADFSRSGNGQREAYGAEARYYVLPLGGYVNVAPTLGYRSVSAPGYNTDGLDLGLRLMIIPSRGGAADLALSQHWVAPGTDREVGLTRINLGYAVTSQLRIGSDLEFQNSRFGQESRWGVGLEWLL
ncbi:MAG: hypothetical protein VKI82_12330 [Leptolyngbya sp.]|nr:hypothetical protein [Leptolyngbya sp.]